MTSTVTFFRYVRTVTPVGIILYEMPPTTLEEVRRLSTVERSFGLLMIRLIDVEAAEVFEGGEPPEVLRAIACGKMTNQLGELGTVGHDGRNEFAVLLPQVKRAETIKLAAQLKDGLYLALGDQAPGVRIGVGFANAPRDTSERQTTWDAVEFRLVQDLAEPEHLSDVQTFIRSEGRSAYFYQYNRYDQPGDEEGGAGHLVPRDPPDPTLNAGAARKLGG